jgi:peptide/nickel transport system substrate-binding protein
MVANPGHTAEIVVAIQSDGKSLDPHTVSDAASIHLIENMYSTLLRYKDGTYGEVEPDLAESYEISDDGKTYTFHLRQGVTFHESGKEVTASDVKYSIERMIEQKARASYFELLDAMQVVDDDTIVITLKEPMAPFLIYLANPMSAIVDQEVVEKNGGSLDRADAGCGPFMLAEWKKDQHLILVKNPDYFVEGLPYLDKVVFRPIPDETAQTTAIRNKEVDIILDVTTKQAMVLQKAGSVVVKSVPGTFWEYLGINTSNAPLDDARVRQAISYAINREAINKMVKFGMATVLDGGVLPETHWAYADLHLYAESNLDKAKQLLQDAGVGEGFATTIKVGSDFEYQVQAAQIIKQQLKPLGIEVEVSALESGIFFDGLGKHDFDMTVVGWLGFIDPDEFFYNIFHSAGKWNQQVYNNPELDALLEKGRVTIDQQARKETYRNVQETLAQDVPMAFLYMNPRIAAYLENISGFDVNPTVTTISLRSTKKE